MTTLPDVTTLMLGEALVDLVCEQPVDRLTEAPSFAPRFGGTVAGAAVHAARRGARIALAGGVGDDDWGAWLRTRLEDEGVDLTWFRQVAGERTPVAFRTVDSAGEAHADLYGQSLDLVMDAVRPRIAEAVDACDGLFLSATTWSLPPDSRERQVAEAALRRARELERPVVVDLDVGPERFVARDGARAAAATLVPGAALVIVRPRDAGRVTAEEDPAAAAAVLLDRGAAIAVVGDAGGAVVRGPGIDRTVPAPPAAPAVDPTGVEAALAGTLLAALELSAWYPAAVAAALPEAVAEAAAVAARWGGLEPVDPA